MWKIGCSWNRNCRIVKVWTASSEHGSLSQIKSLNIYVIKIQLLISFAEVKLRMLFIREVCSFACDDSRLMVAYRASLGFRRITSYYSGIIYHRSFNATCSPAAWSIEPRKDMLWWVQVPYVRVGFHTSRITRAAHTLSLNDTETQEQITTPKFRQQ